MQLVVGGGDTLLLAVCGLLVAVASLAVDHWALGCIGPEEMAWREAAVSPGGGGRDPFLCSEEVSRGKQSQ